MVVSVATVTQEQSKACDTRSKVMDAAEPLRAASKEERQQRYKAVCHAMAAADGKISAETLTAANTFYVHALGDFDVPEAALQAMVAKQLEISDGGDPEKLAANVDADMLDGGQRGCSMIVGLEMALGLSPVPW
eukprot:TRINITY_DN3872_c0_g5_i1.p1 TRINITY_DN3872_c0_g5~~TRINITY_DN3872_c0_g5_i1.p1  ORF type:complete len:134 (+),score=39.27 TRINITY_DN3872_c0_g5_i1:50-451(+)